MADRLNADPLPESHRMADPVEGQQLHYYLFNPTGQLKKGPRPLILFLHGAGERGDDLSKALRHRPKKHLQAVNSLQDAYILIPQCPRDSWWRPKVLMSLIDSVIKDPKTDVDLSRIYVTGLSMGGYGTWNLLAHYPTFFAAAAPICGGGDISSLGIKLNIKRPPTFKTEGLDRATNVAVWGFHGKKDTAVPYSQSVDLTERLKTAGNEGVVLTIYEDAGHDAWSRTYANPKLYEWLFVQKRARTHPQDPTRNVVK